MKALIILPALLSHAVRAIPSIPQATNVGCNEWDPQGWTPRPTEIPHHELLKRNLEPRALTSGQLVGYLAPDNTCGWVNGQLAAPITCSTDSRCAAVAAISGIPGQFGCCNNAPDGNCLFYGTCYNSLDFFSSSACDHACQQATNVILCTSAARPFCYEYSIAGISATAFGCDSTTGLDTMFTSWQGETDGRTMITVYNTDLSSSAAIPLPTQSSQTTPSTTSSASTTTSTGPATSTAPPSSGGSKTPVGAIVGGVVGGLAVIGAVVGIIIFMLLRRRKRASTPPDQSATTQTPQQPYPPPGDNRASYYTHDSKPPMDTMNSPMSPTPTYLSHQQMPSGQYQMPSEHYQVPPQQMQGDHMAPQHLAPQQYMSPSPTNPSYMHPSTQDGNMVQHAPPQQQQQSHHFELQ